MKIRSEQPETDDTDENQNIEQPETDDTDENQIAEHLRRTILMKIRT